MYKIGTHVRPLQSTRACGLQAFVTGLGEEYGRDCNRGIDKFQNVINQVQWTIIVEIWKARILKHIQKIGAQLEISRKHESIGNLAIIEKMLDCLVHILRNLNEVKQQQQTNFQQITSKIIEALIYLLVYNKKVTRKKKYQLNRKI